MYVETPTASTPRRTKRRGRHPHNALAPAFVRTAPPGHHIDGNGLYLYVQPTRARSWIQRLVIRGRRCELGLGSVALVSLAEAREKAVANRKLARSGGDPLADKRRLQSVPTFAEATVTVVEQKRAGWKNPVQATAWRQTLERHAFPRIGRMPVSEVTSADVLAILTPIWHTKPVAAKYVRQRLHAVTELRPSHTASVPVSGTGRRRRRTTRGRWSRRRWPTRCGTRSRPPTPARTCSSGGGSWTIGTPTSPVKVKRRNRRGADTVPTLAIRICPRYHRHECGRHRRKPEVGEVPNATTASVPRTGPASTTIQTRTPGR